MSESQSLRVGIVGAGNISQYHLQALQRVRRAKVVGITDLNRERAQELATRFGVSSVFDSVDDLLGHGIDVVHILTFPASHAELTIQSLETGAHVLVEKPMAVSEEECDRIIETALRVNKIVCVDHAMLRDPFVVKALDMVRAGKIGDVLTVDYFKSQMYPPYQGGPPPVHYRDGGYPFRDVGVHALYLLQEFLGAIEDVSAQFRSGGDDPNLLYSDWRTVVRCRHGTGQFHLTWNTRPLQNFLIIQGTRGVIRADLFGMNVTIKPVRRMPEFVMRGFNAGAESWQTATQVPFNVLRVLLKRIRRMHGLQQLVADFYDSLANNQPPPVTAEDAKPIVIWTERIARQADEAKEKWQSQFPTEVSAKILLTGGTGFIGGHLLRRLLADGQRVRLFARREPAAEIMNDDRIEVVIGDLGDPDAVDRAVAGTELIYHVGAAIKGNVADFDRGTIIGTQNIVNSALQHKVPRLVYISSLSVLHAAAAKAGDEVSEDWPVEPFPNQRGHYTRTKLAAENIIRAAVKEKKLPAIILRPGQVFGPGAKLMTPAVALQRGQRLIVLGGGNVTLPLIYVEDLVDAILLVAEQENMDGSIFHIVDSARLTQNELIERYLQLTGHGHSVWHLPRFVVNTLATGVQTLTWILRRPAPLSRYRVRSALAPWVFNCTAAREQLGWKPQIGIEAGLQKTVAAAEGAKREK